jgi:hypothetical protein
LQKKFFNNLLKQYMKKIIFVSFFLSIAAFVSFVSFEPEVIGASSAFATSSYNLTVSSELSLSGCTGSSNMLPSLDLTNNSAVGTSSVCNVKTTNSLGYYITVKATSAPAMRSGSYFINDYASTTPTTWSTGASEALFGFTTYGDRVSSSYWGQSSSGNCGMGGVSSNVTNPGGGKYTGLFTSATTTYNYGAGTSGGGDNFTICVGAAKGSSATVQSGSYQASIVVTATTN